ncbi:MAG: peroxiredoxin family protein, partial [candidate division KSB1 bacterium]|nr:peroxiredoxin family protein [candidate division KSB1 bacterium]
MSRRALLNYAASALLGMAVMAVVALTVANRYLEALVLGRKPLEVGERAPAFATLDLEGQEVGVIGVSAEGGRETAAFVKEHGLRFPVVADPEQRVLEKYRV